MDYFHCHPIAFKRKGWYVPSNIMFKNQSVPIAKVEQAGRLLSGDGKRAGRSFPFRPKSFHTGYYCSGTNIL